MPWLLFGMLETPAQTVRLPIGLATTTGLPLSVVPVTALSIYTAVTPTTEATTIIITLH